MKQEQRLVAEVYRFIAPFVDTEKDLYVSLDGQAAEIGMQQGLFQHRTIPDLWFTFVGATKATLLEAKIIHEERVLLMQSQLRDWKSDGSGTHRPNAWIAAAKPFDRFYLWTHAEFLPRLDAARGKTPTVSIRIPETLRVFQSASQLALQIIRDAAQWSSVDQQLGS
ncbi:MAG TPA: hypothetical protein VG796_24855 [Verrucomicrobiales bacterium]|nr:hypothetical protein [Verrucomicrobiales bacterium]